MYSNGIILGIKRDLNVPVTARVVLIRRKDRGWTENFTCSTKVSVNIFRNRVAKIN